MRYFEIENDRSEGYTGSIHGVHKWGLPGLLNCPGCKTTWSTSAQIYPSVDLTPVTALADFVEARPEPIEEYERMCELVRPLLPQGAVLEPGAAFGPFVGKAHGRFGAYAAPLSWWPMMQREALEKLQAEGLRGLKGCPTQIRFRQRASPVLLELELLPVGHAHPDCLPPNREPPCPRCGRLGLTLPKSLVLDASTLPDHLDLFRLRDFSTVVVCTERFVEAYQRLGLDGAVFSALPTHPVSA